MTVHDTPRNDAWPALRIVIAGGGTGGHLFPGIAIAREFMARNPQNGVLFVGTGKPMETSVLSKAGFDFEKISAEGLKGRGLIAQIRSLAKIPKGVIESVKLLRRFRPHLVVGVGGYAAGPLVMGAKLLGVRIALHEQNVMPGITNRVLARFADRVFVSFENTRLDARAQKVRITGNPVRREILDQARDRRAPSQKVPERTRPFTTLIVGGSQGAHALNLAMVEAMGRIKEKNAFSFVHQTGDHDEAMVKDAYRRHGLSAVVQAFFNDIARQYRDADLVVCRAGATTVAEIAAVGKGALFVPFPHAADNHQVLNARSLADAGAAEVILQEDLSGETLAGRILFYASNPEALDRMAARAAEMGRPDAAAAIVDECYALQRKAHVS